MPALLAAVNSTAHVHLVVGSNPLAGARCGKALEVGAKPKLIAPADSSLHYGLAKRIDDGEVEWLKRGFEDKDLTTLGRQEVDHVVDAVFVTLGGHNPLSLSQRDGMTSLDRDLADIVTGTHISNLCRRLRIPLNVADTPSLCTFTLLSTYTSGPLQIGVTTSGKGCHLSSRIRREVVSSLPPNLGPAVERLGKMRRRIQQEDYAAELNVDPDAEIEDDNDGQSSAFNRLVRAEDFEAAKTRRMRWLQQICEYWPLRRLASITDADVDAVLRAYSASSASKDPELVSPALPPCLSSVSSLSAPRGRGTIILAGSGPGHPSLLTLATLRAIQTADLVLADKLVPAPVLELIPRRTDVKIARKFPGNADAAQDELLSLGHAGLKEGKTVLRLKQGDPFLYGRGGEEVAWFREKGFEAVVLPGLTSSLSGPLFAGVPVTHRAVSDGVVVCTGTGRKGKPPAPPGYVQSRTVVWLMALHRIDALVKELVEGPRPQCGEQAIEEISDVGVPGMETFANWPPATPCAVIERASCPDQRVIRTTLQHVAHAIEECGSRPPGLLVAGRACEVLHELEKGRMWTVEEGLGEFGRWSQAVVDGALGINGRPASDAGANG